MRFTPGRRRQWRVGCMLASVATVCCISFLCCIAYLHWDGVDGLGLGKGPPSFVLSQSSRGGSGRVHDTEGGEDKREEPLKGGNTVDSSRKTVSKQGGASEGQSHGRADDNHQARSGPLQRLQRITRGTPTTPTTLTATTTTTTSNAHDSVSGEQRDKWRARSSHELKGLHDFGIEVPENTVPLDDAQEVDFTLVTQTSPSRLWVLEHICERWSGPMVVSVNTHGLSDKEKDTHRETVARCPQAHGIFVEDVEGWTDEQWADPNHFPINILRNMAIAEVRTSHYLMVDVDLWPSRGLYEKLRGLSSLTPDTHTGADPHTHAHAHAFRDPFNAFVVPAFELKAVKGREDKADPRALPGDTHELKACLHSKNCAIFKKKLSPDGHKTTNTARWLTRQKPDELYDIPCFTSDLYEPYLVLRKGSPTPTYAEVFTGFGKNKIQHVVHLRMRGFKFLVLPESFVCHFPHKTSEARNSWGQKGSTHREKVEDMYARFLEWVRWERASRIGKNTPLCSP